MSVYDVEGNDLDNLGANKRVSLYNLINAIDWDNVPFANANGETLVSSALSAWQSSGSDVVAISVSYTGEPVIEAGTSTSSLALSITGTLEGGGTRAISSGYTLSPATIVEGVNTVTVYYGDLSDTFKVSGIAQNADVYLYHFNDSIAPVHITEDLGITAATPAYGTGVFDKASEITNVQASALYTPTTGGVGSFTGKFTIAFWAKGTDTANNQFFCNTYYRGGTGVSSKPAASEFTFSDGWGLDSTGSGTISKKTAGTALIWYNSKFYFRTCNNALSYGLNIHLQKTGFDITSWHHYVISRDADNVLRLFIDGTEIMRITYTYDLYVSPYTGFGYGSNESSAQTTPNYSSGVGSTNGTVWIDELLIVNGSCLYDSNFVAPTKPYDI